MVGVSPTTVSFVLNGREKEMRISEEVTSKILKVAREMSYQPNNIAVALRTGQTRIIGLIVEDIGNHFFSNLAKTIEEELNAHNYQVVYCSTENQNKKADELITMLQRQQVDGYLVTPNAGMATRLADLVKKNLPVVQIDRYFGKIKCPYVMADNYGGIVQGVTHLLTNGRKKIGFVTVDMDLVQMKDRERGYVDTLRKHKIPVKKSQVLKLNYNFTKNASVEAIREFLQTQELDAVLFATNYVGIAGLQAIKDLDIKIPSELAVVCFDDNELFNFCTPTITAIQQPIQAIAKAAVQILMGEMGITEKSKTTELQLATRMIYRDSV